MKRDIIHKRSGETAALRLALFAVLLAGPFAASAQTGAKPAANAVPWNATYPNGIPYQKNNGDIVYIRGIPPGPSEAEINRKRVWDETRKERKIILEGTFKGSGTFIFEGRTITYRRESGEYPIVTVNARYWGDEHWGLGIPTGTFMLPFMIETADFELAQTEGTKPVKVTKGKSRFEVSFEKPEATDGEASRYSITITPGKQAEAENQQEPAAENVTIAAAASKTQTGTKPAKTEAQTGAKTVKKPAATDPRGAIPGGLKASRGGDFHYNGISDTIYYKPDGPDGPVLEYGLDGDGELEEQERPNPALHFVGGHDMNHDHRVDLVAWRFVEGDSGRSIEVGYGESGKLEKWHVIGVLGVPEGVSWDLYCGNLTGHAWLNSILWHSPDLGALGYWPDGKGVDSWVSIPGEYKAPEWKVLGLGRFAGSTGGRASVLFQYGANTIGHVTTDGKFVELGRLDDGWEIAAVGTFSNSGYNDLILFNHKLNQVGMWEGGLSRNWTSLGFVEAGTVIEGAGDYDGDGPIDLLARKADGTMGCYPKADLNKFRSFGYTKDPSWVVIP